MLQAGRLLADPASAGGDRAEAAVRPAVLTRGLCCCLIAATTAASPRMASGSIFQAKRTKAMPHQLGGDEAAAQRSFVLAQGLRLRGPSLIAG
jgi:hypothetical protein